MATVLSGEFLTPAEAAKLLKLHHSIVCRYCRTGALPAKKVGRDWLIRREDAEAFTPNPPGNPEFRRRNHKGR